MDERGRRPSDTAGWRCAIALELVCSGRNGSEDTSRQGNHHQPCPVSAKRRLGRFRHDIGVEAVYGELLFSERGYSRRGLCVTMDSDSPWISIPSPNPQTGTSSLRYSLTDHRGTRVHGNRGYQIIITCERTERL